MIKKGLSKQEFKELFDVYFERIKYFIYYKTYDEEIASDMTQEVFLKIWEQRKTVRKSTVVSLLYTIANNVFVSKWRKDKTAIKFVQRIEADRKNNDSPEANYTYKETKANYEQILSKMPEDYRVAFLMSRVEELKYREIAKSLEVSMKTVEKRISKALAILKEGLNY